jgi:hypothetical protein
MKNVRLDRLELLDIVKTNKEKHIADFKEAVTDYKKAVINVAKENLAVARTGDLIKFRQFRTMPAPPASYEDSYSRAIRMLELSVDSCIELEEQVFNQLVLDEWQWKSSFTTMSATYKSLS